jgi:hypothetical protein
MIIGPDPEPRDLTGLALVAHVSLQPSGTVGDPYPWWVTENGSTIDTGYCNIGSPRGRNGSARPMSSWPASTTSASAIGHRRGTAR